MLVILKVTVFWNVMKALKIGAAHSSRTSVKIYWTKCLHVTEDSNLQHRWIVLLIPTVPLLLPLFCCVLCSITVKFGEQRDKWGEASYWAISYHRNLTRTIHVWSSKFYSYSKWRRHGRYHEESKKNICWNFWRYVETLLIPFLYMYII